MSDSTESGNDNKWGSDVFVDLLQELGFSHIPFNPGATFRGLEESLVNYGNNNPTVVETPHEGLTVSIAHGIAKSTNQPSVCVLHNVVGTLHGTMSIFNAFCDRVPMVILAGCGPLAKSDRRPWIDSIHTALIQGNIVRDFVKWDDQPMDIPGTIESIQRGYKIANTPPKGPVYITIDSTIQEELAESGFSLDSSSVSRSEPPSAIHPDPTAIKQAAELIESAEFPVIISDRTSQVQHIETELEKFAEQIGAPILDPFKSRYTVSNQHGLYLQEMDTLSEADVLLNLDVRSIEYMLKSVEREVSDYTIIDIGYHEVGTSSLIPYNNELHNVAVSIMSDPATAISELQNVTDLSETDSATRRKQHIQQELKRSPTDWHQKAQDEWDESPISTARLAYEIGEVIQDEEWTLVNGSLSDWEHRFWTIDEPEKYYGRGSGGEGLGYGIGAAIGGAFVSNSNDRIPVNIQADGDFMCYPNALWILGHFELPLFTVMHNNQSYYNSTEHRMNLAASRGRNADYEQALIGTGLVDPTPDYATMAESMGVSGFGPIDDPDNLREELEAAWQAVKDGKPVLVDVICQPR